MADAVEADEAALESRYNAALEGQEEGERTRILSMVDPATKELQDLCKRYDVKLDEQQEELQAAVLKFESAERLVNSLSSQADDNAQVIQARTEHREASEAMELCMSARSATARAYAAAKEQARAKRFAAIREALGDTPATNDLPTDAKTGDDAAKGGDEEEAEYEAFRPHRADLIIRVGGSFAKLGINVDEEGVITRAPRGLFDSDYTIVGIDGVRFYPGLQNSGGTHNVILRCKKADVLESLSRLPPKHLSGKVLKLMQVKISPGDEGFGIDLSELNAIAGVVKGGKAEAADLRVGDVIISADGIYLGAKRLVEVLPKGTSSYIFNVVRPTAPGAQDWPGNLSDPPSQEPSPAMVANEDDPLKRSLAESLGRLQMSTDMLAGPTARIVHGRCRRQRHYRRVGSSSRQPRDRALSPAVEAHARQ